MPRAAPASKPKAKATATATATAKPVSKKVTSTTTTATSPSSDAKGKRKRTDDDDETAAASASTPSKSPKASKSSSTAAAKDKKKKPKESTTAGRKKQNEPRALNVAKTKAVLAAKAEKKAGMAKQGVKAQEKEGGAKEAQPDADADAEAEGKAARQKARKAVVSAASDDEGDDEEEEEEEEGEEDAGADSSDEEDEGDAGGKTFDTVRLPSSKDDKIVKARLEAVKKSRKAKGADSAAPGVLYFGRLPSGLNESTLKPYLSQFGQVTRIRMSRNKRTGAFRHYGFVEFADEEVARIVQETMNNYLVENRLLQVRMVPKDQVHPALWIGANRKFRKVPVGRAHRVKHNAPKTPEAAAKASEKLLLRQEARKDKLKSSGIDYDFEGYKKV